MMFPGLRLDVMQKKKKSCLPFIFFLSGLWVFHGSRTAAVFHHQLRLFFLHSFIIHLVTEACDAKLITPTFQTAANLFINSKLFQLH